MHGAAAEHNSCRHSSTKQSSSAHHVYTHKRTEAAAHQHAQSSSAHHVYTHKHAKAAHPDPSRKGKPHGLLLLTGLKNSDWPDGTVPFSLQRLSLAMYRVLELSLSLPPAVPVRRYPVMFAVWPPMLRMTTCAVLPAPGMGVTLWMMSLAWVLPLHSAGAGDCRDDRHSVQQHRCSRRRRSCMQNT